MKKERKAARRMTDIWDWGYSWTYDKNGIILNVFSKGGLVRRMINKLVCQTSPDTKYKGDKGHYNLFDI